MNPFEDRTKSQDHQSRSFKLLFHLKDKLLLPVDIYPTDSLLDIRQFLSETSQLFFISSYHFEYNGNVLNEYLEVVTQCEIHNEARIDIKIDPFDEKTSRYHLKKVQEFFASPFTFQNIFGNILKAVKDPQALAEELKHLEEENQREEEENQKNNRDHSQTKKFTLAEAIKSPLSVYQDISLKKQVPDKLEFVKSLTFSSYNPPSPHRKLKGDFFYLTLKTLEGTEYHITACSRGFYANTIESEMLNPNSQTSHIFYNLVDLICFLSTTCKNSLQKLRDHEIKDEYLELKPLNLYVSETRWLGLPHSLDSHSYEADPTRAENSLLNFHGFDPSGIRDWNEEIQMCKELPKGDLIQRLNREKAILKTHTDFVEAATQGAKGIVDKYIQPLNQQDPEHQQVFVYNYIFFSYVIHTPDSFKQEKGPEASPTTTMANNDLRNLKILHRLDVPDLHLLNTAIIDYKGQRVLAQTIIPGILNTDHSQCTEFGTIDDGKTIQNNPSFAELMKKVCEYFSLVEDVECLDEANNKYVMPASPEVKGIRGSDKKKFLLDLLRLSPRDSNWLGEDCEYLCCVIRPELISHYIASRNFQIASENVRKELEEQRKQTKGEIKDDQKEIVDSKESKDDIDDSKDTQDSQETKDSNNSTTEKKITYVEFMHRIQDYLMKNSSSFQIRFNPNLYTRVQMAESIKLDEDRKNLAELANFINKQAIPSLINEIVAGDIILPCDSKTLGELLHANGINEEYRYLHVLLERVMFAKSMKHYIKESFRNTAPMYYSEMIAHIFNCVFSGLKFIHYIETEEGIKSLDPHLNDKDDDIDVEGKKKKKKKKAVNTKKTKDFDCYSSLLMQFSIVDMDPPEYNFIHLKPSQVWKRIQEICKKRYLYSLPESIDDFDPFHYKLTKLATLRDVCLSTGIVLECKDYEVMDEDETGMARALKPTFVPDNILDMVPVIKHLDPICENAKLQIELTNKLIAEGKFEEAMETLMSAVQIILNIFGPIHKDVAYCYAKMANLYFKMSDMNQAILYNKQSARVLEKLYGVDNPQTAHAYSTLALLYYTNKNHQKSFEYMLKSLYVFNTVGGEFHPEGAMIYSNLALMYQDADKQQSAINCLFEALERNYLMFGLESFKVANSYQCLSIAHYDIHDFKKAIDFQEKAIEILRKILTHEDPRIKDSVVFLEKIRKSLDLSLSPSNPIKKTQKKSPKDHEEEKDKITKEIEELDDLDNLMKSKVEFSYSTFTGAQERERLLQRMKLAKLNAKYGFRKPGNLDYSKILQQYYMIGNPNHEETKTSGF